MTHHLRVFSQATLQIPLHRLEERLRSERLYAQFKAPGILLRNWEQLVILDGQNRELALLDRRPASRGTPGRKGIERFIGQIGPLRPKSGAAWLSRYLKRVKVIYTLQVISDAMAEEGWRIVTELQREIFETAGGVLQEDGAGFTNDLGFNILWQFPDGMRGRWPFAVRRLGQWIAFEMDVENAKQRQAFLGGRVPPDAKLL